MRDDRRRRYVLDLEEEIQLLRHDEARSSRLVSYLIRFQIARLENERNWQARLNGARRASRPGTLEDQAQ